MDYLLRAISSRADYDRAVQGLSLTHYKDMGHTLIARILELGAEAAWVK